jgi:short-subunit dehydrogenase
MNLERLANLWINRGAFDAAAHQRALQAVAGLGPAVVVTGGSRGLGLALAGQFARAGHDVVIVARNGEIAGQAATRIAKQTGRRCTAIPLDITAPGILDALDRSLSAAGHYADVLVNNAGLGHAGPFAEANPETLAQLVALNIDAPARLARHLLPGMLARRRGGILSVASLGGAVPGPGQAAYYASKAFLMSLTEALAAECAGQGVRISILAPGPLDTDFHAAMGAENSAYRVLIPAVSLQRTARAGYWGFILGRRLIVPGVINRLIYGALRILPHPVSMPLVKALLARRRA